MSGQEKIGDIDAVPGYLCTWIGQGDKQDKRTARSSFRERKTRDRDASEYRIVFE